MKIKVIDYGYENLPVRKHYNDAGADVYIHIKDRTKILRLPPNDTVAIPLGFGLEIPDGYAAFIFPRSSLSGEGIVCELPPVDSGYKGEIHAIVTNNTGTGKWLRDGTRIGQLVILPVVIADFVTDLGNERGRGAFGSTGTQ